ncbi:2-succinyl-5-enolpyruvyl-6-hydroxy-3-cyclohexene-1-carboxylic-acid synthase [Thiolapillus sp.]
MDQGRINLDASLALLDGLVEAGLKRLVFSPGSRSTPLTLAALLHEGVEAFAAVDERSAAWLGLGMARASGCPVALVCTSGTAVANWHPAVVEADRQEVPLILLSADRPWELHHCNANQTIDQVAIFGRHVRSFHQLSAPHASSDLARRLRALGRQLLRESLGPGAGPVHLNFPFREPLVPEKLPPTITAVGRKPLKPGILCLEPAELNSLARELAGGKGVIVCGPGALPVEILELGKACGAPVLADPLSGLRFLSSHRSRPLAAYDLFLRNPTTCQRLQPDWVLHFGGLPVSKTLQNWLSRNDQKAYWWVNDAGRSLDLPGRRIETLAANPARLVADLCAALPSPTSASWLEEWRKREQQAQARLERTALPLEAQLLRTLLDELPDDSLLFLSNSLPVRFFDACSGTREKTIALHGNRGASGIDGNLSTLAGLASAWRGSGLAVGVLGDLAFFHDLNALALCREQNLLLLLFNNGGGGIFDYLPQHELALHEQGWRTPVPMDYQSLAAAFGISCRQLRGQPDIEPVLAEVLSETGCRLVEIVIDAEASRQQYLRLIRQFVEQT